MGTIGNSVVFFCFCFSLSSFVCFSKQVHLPKEEKEVSTARIDAYKQNDVLIYLFLSIIIFRFLSLSPPHTSSLFSYHALLPLFSHPFFLSSLHCRLSPPFSLPGNASTQEYIHVNNNIKPQQYSSYHHQYTGDPTVHFHIYSRVYCSP